MMTGSDIGLRQVDSKLVPDKRDDVGGQADVFFLQLVAGLDETNFTLGLVRGLIYPPKAVNFILLSLIT